MKTKQTWKTIQEPNQCTYDANVPEKWAQTFFPSHKCFNQTCVRFMSCVHFCRRSSHWASGSQTCWNLCCPPECLLDDRFLQSSKASLTLRGQMSQICDVYMHLVKLTFGRITNYSLCLLYVPYLYNTVFF